MDALRENAGAGHFFLSISDASPYVDPRTGETLLHMAVKYGDEEDVRHVLSLPGLDVNAVRHESEWSSSYTALHDVCWRGTFGMFTALLADDRVSVTVDALIDACANERLDMVRVLMNDTRIDPNGEKVCEESEEQNSRRLPQTPLCACVHASDTGPDSVLQYLLNDERIEIDLTFWDVAVQDKSVGVVQALLDCRTFDLDLEYALSTAVEFGQSLVVDMILRHPRFFPTEDGSVVTKDARLTNAFTDAIRRGFVFIAMIFLNSGRIDVNAPNTEGVPPIVLAARNECMLRHLLMDPLINVNAATPTGRTAMHHAAAHNWVACLRVLLHQPRIDDVNVRASDTGETPLMCACREGLWRNVDCLVRDSRVDLCAVAHNGDTALSIAMRAKNALNQRQMVVHLLSAAEKRGISPRALLSATTELSAIPTLTLASRIALARADPTLCAAHDVHAAIRTKWSIDRICEFCRRAVDEHDVRLDEADREVIRTIFGREAGERVLGACRFQGVTPQ